MRFAALLISTSLALGLAPRAAEAADPIGVWLEAAVRAEPVDDLRITVSNQVRFTDSFERLGRVLPEVSLAYRPPLLSAGLGSLGLGLLGLLGLGLWGRRES